MFSLGVWLSECIAPLHCFLFQASTQAFPHIRALVEQPMLHAHTYALHPVSITAGDAHAHACAKAMPSPYLCPALKVLANIFQERRPS